MPKKRVGVSLRKPSPAPEVAATSTDAPIASTSEAASVSTAASVETVLREGLVESAPVTQAAPLQVQVIEAFVNGANLALEAAATVIPTAKLEELLERGREGFKELTLYLPEKLAEKLSLHCREHNLDLSELVATLVENHLNPPVVEPAVAAVPNERALAIAARGLLVDLAGWVRAVWATRRNKTWPGRPVAAAT